VNLGQPETAGAAELAGEVAVVGAGPAAEVAGGPASVGRVQPPAVAATTSRPAQASSVRITAP
jgi:hypothetical protein